LKIRRPPRPWGLSCLLWFILLYEDNSLFLHDCSISTLLFRFPCMGPDFHSLLRGHFIFSVATCASTGAPRPIIEYSQSRQSVSSVSRRLAVRKKSFTFFSPSFALDLTERLVLTGSNRRDFKAWLPHHLSPQTRFLNGKTFFHSLLLFFLLKVP